MASAPTSPPTSSPDGAPPSSAGQRSDAAVAGRGVLYIAFAKFYFMVSGAVLELSLPSALGATVYGAYRVVNSLVSPLNNVLITGTIQSVSRFSSQRPETAGAVQRAGLRMQLFIGLVLAILFAALAPVIAHFFHDASKTGPIMLAAVIVGAYSFYAVFVGTANGRREFHKQAVLDITSATLRVGGMLTLVMLGFGLYGAIGAWAAAAVLILGISTVVVGTPRRLDDRPHIPNTLVGSFSTELPANRRSPSANPDLVQPVRPLATFFGNVATYLILLNLIMVADQLLLKRLAAEWFAHHGHEALAALRSYMPHGALAAFTSVDPARAADGQVGHYGAVQQLARLSYQLIIAGNFVIFPLISRTTFENDRETTSRYIRTSFRYSTIFATAIAVVLASNPTHILAVPFPPDFAAAGGPALVALALGNVAFSLVAITGTILNGAGKTRHAILLAAAVLAVAAVGNLIVIPRFVPGRALLTACASATAGAMLLGAAVGGILLRRTLGGFLPLASLVRVALSAGVAIALGRLLDLSGTLMTLAGAAAVGLVFVVMLVVTGELGRADLATLRKVVRGKKGDA